MNLPYDIHKNIVWLGMEQAKLLMRDVATGHRTTCMVCSDTGYGKTFEAKKILRTLGIAFSEANPKTDNALAQVLWGFASGAVLVKGRRVTVIILDDVDALARNETPSNLMKSAFGAERKIIFETAAALRNEQQRIDESPRYRKEIAPPQFNVPVRLIWLSNVNWTDPTVFGSTPEHFKALVSKGLDPLWIPNDAEHDGLEVFICTHWLATEGKGLRSLGYPYDVARDAVAYYVEYVHRLIDICPRRLTQIAEVIRSNANPGERDLRLRSMLRPDDQRPKLILPHTWLQVLLWPHDPPQPKVPPPQVEPASHGDNVIPLRQPTPSAPPPDPEPPEPSPAASQPVPDPELETKQGLPQPDPANLVIRDTAVGPFDPDADHPESQRDPDTPPGEPAPETPTSQQNVLVPDTPPSEEQGRDPVDTVDHELSVSLEKQPPDPRHMPIGSVDLTDGVNETEDKWDLRPIRAGRASPDDRAMARWNRAAAFHLLGEIDDDVFVDQAAKKLRIQGHRFWRGLSNSTLSEAVLAVANTPTDPPSDPKAGSDDTPADEPL